MWSRAFVGPGALGIQMEAGSGTGSIFEVSQCSSKLEQMYLGCRWGVGGRLVVGLET